MTISWARAVSRINSRQRSPTSPPRTAKRYFVVQTTRYLQSQTVWLPRLYPSILPVYAAKCPGPKPPKGVGFTDPLSGTLNRRTHRGSIWTTYCVPPIVEAILQKLEEIAARMSALRKSFWAACLLVSMIHAPLSRAADDPLVSKPCVSAPGLSL